MTIPLRIASVVGLAALMFVAGLALGHRTTFDRTMRMLAAETQYNLLDRVETLAHLRTGDVGGAVSHLEEAVDRVSVTLGQGRPWSELDPEVRPALQLVRAYRDVHPSSDPELVRLLVTVPPADARHCSPALQRLLTRSGR